MSISVVGERRIGERRPVTPADDAPDPVGPAHEVAGQLHLRSNVPPPHLLKVMREGRVWRRLRRPRRISGHYAQLADLVEFGSADDIEGFAAARYWTRRNGWHRQLTAEAISDMVGLRRAAKRKREGLDVSAWVKAYRERDAQEWADTERRAAECRAAGDHSSIHDRLLANTVREQGGKRG